MQHRRCKQHLQITAFHPLYPLHVDPNAMDMGQVVGANLLARWQVFQQLGGEMLERGKHFTSHLSFSIG